MKHLFLFLEKFHQNEKGAVESLQVVLLLGLAALLIVFLIATQYIVEAWSKDRINIILMEENEPEDTNEDFDVPDWTRPGNG